MSRAFSFSFTTEDGTFLSAMVNNPVTIHFIHRNLAYLLTILIVVWTIKATKEKTIALFNRIKWMPLALVITQVVLGVATVLTSIKKVPQKWGVFEGNAQLHQIVAMLLLLSLISCLFLHSTKRSAAM